MRRAGPTSQRVDPDSIKGSRRSNPAAYTGLLDPIRKAFAKANGVKPALFSANSEGACSGLWRCRGHRDGLGDHGLCQRTLPRSARVARFRPEVLEHALGGRSIL